MSVLSASLTSISPDSGTAADFITNQTTLTLSGSLSQFLGGTLGVWISGGSFSALNGGKGILIGSVTLGVFDGSWTLANDNIAAAISAAGASLTDGTYTISFTNGTATNASTIGTSHTLVFDTTPPAAPGTPDLLAASDSGSSNSDNITNNTAPTFTGTAEAGSTVTIYSDGIAVGSGVATGGVYSISTSTLTSGPHNITATQSDEAGNDSVASAPLVVTIDTTGPSAVATVTALSNDTGTPGDFLTSASSQTVSGTFTGTLAAGDIIQVSANGGVNWVNATPSGSTWSASGVTLTAAGTTLSVRTVDSAGNTTAGVGHSYALTFPPTVSSVVTSGPGITAGTGSVGPGGTVTFTVNFSAAVTVAGGTPTLALSDGKTATYQSGSGSGVLVFTYTVGAGDTSADLTVTAFNLNAATVRDASGNNAVLTGAVTNPAGVLVIDTTAPAAPSVPDLIATSDSGASTTDNLTNVATPTFFGTAETGSTVTIYSDGVAVGSGIATAGSYSIATTALANGVHNITARATDAAGNVSPASGGLSITLDTIAPAAVAAVTAISADSGNSGSDFITNVAGQTVSGTFTGVLASGETIQVSADGGTSWVTATSSGATWSATGVTLIPGGTTLTVRTIDTAGNVTAGTGHGYTLDIAAPAVSSVATSGPGVTAGAGNLSVGGVVTLTVAFTEAVTVAGGTPTLTLNDGGIATYQSGSGTSSLVFTYTVAAGQNTADLTVTAFNLNAATVKDAAGNTAVTTGAVTNPAGTLIIDTTGPAAPSTPDMAAASDSGSSSTDNTTSVPTPTFMGTAETGSTVSIFSDGTLVGTGVASGGNYSIVASALTNGTHSITATATDSAGNTGLASGGLSITIDTIAPAAAATVAAISADSGTAGDFITNTSAQTVTGTYAGVLAAGETIQVSADGTNWVSASAAGGAWAASGVTLTAAGTTLSVRTVDAAGNITAGSGHAYTLDTSSPTVSAIVATGSGITVGSGTLGIGSTVTLTTNFTETVTVAGGPPTLTLNDGGVATYQSGSGSNALVFTYVVGAGQNTADLTVSTFNLNTGTVRDNAGNNAVVAGTTNPSGILVIDTTAPAVPSVPDMATASDSGTSNSDNITNVSAPTFTGTAESGSTVSIFSDGTLVGTGLAAVGNGSYSITTLGLTSGTHSITARATDASGNPSAASSGLSITIDTAAPGAPTAPDLLAASDSGTSNTDNITSNTTPTFTGTAESGSTVLIYSDGTQVGSGIATGGAYSIASSALAAGTRNITATATDAAGNVSVLSAAMQVTIDSAAPTISNLVVSDSAVSFTATDTGGGALSLTGALAGAFGSPTVFNGDTTILTPTAQASITTGTLQVTDLAGNLVNVLALEIGTGGGDTIAGTSGADFIYGLAGNDTITGGLGGDTMTGGAGTDVFNFNAGDSVLSIGGSGTNGTISGYDVVTDFTPGLEKLGFPSLTLSVQASTTGANGSDSTLLLNTSTTVKSHRITSGIITFDDNNNFNTAVSLNSLSDVAAVSEYLLNQSWSSGSSMAFVATIGGVAHTFVFRPSSSDSNAVLVDLVNVTATSITAAGSGGSGAQLSVFGAAAPTITVATDDVAPVTGTLTSGDTTNDTTPTVKVNLAGTGAVAGNQIKLYSGTGTGTQLGSTYTLVAADITNGYANVTTGTLSSGTTAITARLTVGATQGAASNAFTVVVDTTAPTSTATVTALSADTGASATDFITNLAAQTVTGTFTGTLGAGETIQVSADGGVTWITATAGSGSWTAAGVTLAAAGTTLSVRTVDAAGNVTAGTGHGYTLDTAAPTAVATVTALSADTGTAGDFLTNVAAQTVSGTFTGTLSAGESIQVSANGGANWVTATTGSGTWTASGVTLTAAGTTLLVRTVDTAGNAVAGIGRNYTLDTTAPTAVATVTALSVDTGTAGDFITSTAAQTVSGSFSGTLGSGETIQVSADGGANWVTATTAGATWSASGVTLAAAGTTLSVRTIDSAGNATAGTGHAYTLDTAAPGAVATVTALSADTRIAGDFVTSVAAQTVTGTYTGALLAGETIQVSANGGVDWISATAGGGTWSAAGVTLTAAGTALSVRTIDAAGNTAAGTGHSYTLDGTAPTAVATVTALSADSGTLAGDFVTNVASQTVSGTFTGALGAGETIEVSADGGATWVAATPSGATWSASGVTLPAAGTALSVRTIDGAGNTTAGAGHSYRLDTTGPAETFPTITLTADTGVSAADYITKNGAVTFSGTVSDLGAGLSTVQLFDGLTLLGTATVISGAWTFGTTLAAGTHAVTARATDIAGNITNVTHPQVIIVDATTPSVTSVTAPSGDDGPGTLITFTVNFSEAVSVGTSGGTPYLMLSNSQHATYASGSGTAALSFAYTVGATGSGEDIADLSVSGLTPSGGTIVDLAGNAADLSGAAANPPGTLRIDTTAPTVVDSTASEGTFLVGQTAVFTLTTSEAVTAVGSPTLTLSNGATAVYDAGNSTATSLTFNYLVANGETPAGDVGIFAVNGITDIAGNPLLYSGNPTGTTNVICFYPGTLIATPSGDRAVESLGIGDLVLTKDGEPMPVRWMGRQTVSTLFADKLRVLPIRVTAGALGANMPVRDLLVSPDHALLVDGILVQAGALVNGSSILREHAVPERFTYWHVELADHSLILAEGVPAETYVDNVDRLTFDNWDEHETLYGGLPAIPELSLPRAKAARQVPLTVRNRLADRASRHLRQTAA